MCVRLIYYFLLSAKPTVSPIGSGVKTCGCVPLLAPVSEYICFCRGGGNRKPITSGLSRSPPPLRPPPSCSTQRPRPSRLVCPGWLEANMGSGVHLCSALLLVFLLVLHHSSGFWIINVIFPPSAKVRFPSNSTPPLVIGECVAGEC